MRVCIIVVSYLSCFHCTAFPYSCLHHIEYIGKEWKREHNSDEMKREIPNTLVKWKECWLVGWLVLLFQFYFSCNLPSNRFIEIFFSVCTHTLNQKSQFMTVWENESSFFLLNNYREFLILIFGFISKNSCGSIFYSNEKKKLYTDRIMRFDCCFDKEMIACSNSMKKKLQKNEYAL